MEQTSWRRRAQAFVPALLLLFALVGWMLPTAPRSVAETDAVLETGEREPCPTVPTGQELIALTFDDSPHRPTTVRLLDGPSERGVKATSFLIGAQIENDGDVVRQMDKKGHQVGIHTFDHAKLTDPSRIDSDTQVKITRALLKSTLGHNNFLLRPPYGMLDKSARAWTGCPTIPQPIDPEDWWDQSTDRVMREVVVEVRDGRIILMHDISPRSMDIALQIVDQPHQQGYLFCMVDELFIAQGLPLEAGEVCWNAYPQIGPGTILPSPGPAV